MKLRASAVVMVVLLGPVLAGCESGAARRFVLALETAQRSRIAYLVRYDKDYAETLEKWVATLRKELDDRDARDPIGLAFALDELADVYATRMVHFEKALAANQEAQDVLGRIGGGSPPGRLGWYFSHRRRLYPFVVGPFRLVGQSGAGLSLVREAEGPIDSGLTWTGGGREAVRTAYPPELLRRIAEHDLTTLKERLNQRARTLRGLLGLDDPRDEIAPATGSPPHLVRLELSTLASTLGALDEYGRSLLLLDRAWSLRGELEPAVWLRAVVEAGEKVMAADARQAEPRDPYPAAVARFRLGMARLWLGLTGGGVRALEEMLALVTAHDQQRQALYEKSRASLRKQRIERGLFNALSFGLAAPLGVFLSERVYAPHFALLEAQFGPGKHGLAAFLDEHERATFHYELGRAYEATGQTAKAIEQYKQAIEIIERQRSTIRTETGRIAYLRDREAPYQRLVPLLVRAGDPAGAFEYAERARSRAFLDLLATGRVRLGVPEEAARYERIVRRQAEIQVLVDAGLPRPLADEMYAAARGIEVRLRAQAPVSLEFEALTTVKTARREEIAAILGRDTALVSLFVGDDETAVLLLQDDTVVGWVRPVGRETLVARVRQMRRLLEAPATGEPDRSDPDMLNQLGAALYADLLAPAFDALRKRIVYVAPHGPLHYVPFAALRDGRGHLLDRYVLLSVPSGTLLTYLSGKSAPPAGPTVVLANPDLGDRRLDLVHAGREGRAIRQRRADTVLLTRQTATEARARELAPTASILHFAAHATLDVRRPLESAVLLAPGGGDDGRLTAGEVFSLRLPASLVVLSACQTGLGPLTSGDDLIGLTRAFMYAGAPHVIATLWPIADESTATLMDEFYAGLSTLPPSEALRAAQLRLRDRHPHPFYWAAFSVFGHYR